MSKIVNVTISDQTKAVTELGMNKILIFTNSADVDYKEVDEISASGLDEASTGYKLLELILAQESQDVAIFGVNAVVDSEIKNELNKIASKDFFFIVSDITSVAGITALGEWATSAEKICVASPLVTEAKANVLSLASTINSDNVGIYHHAGSPNGTGQVYLNAAITGRMAPKTVGKSQWALKSPNSIANEYFELADENEYIAGNVNVWAEELGRGLTKGGKTTSGSYLDITQGKIWLKNKLKSNLSLLFMNAEKIPYTEEGRLLIINEIQTVVNVADTQGIILADKTTITVPHPEDVLTNDRASRVWKNIVVTSQIQGAVESVYITYVLTV